MFAPRKRICLVAGLLCVLGIMPITSCIGDTPREFEAYSAITVDIKRSANQVWHPICREVRLQAEALDIDRWRYTEGCSEWEYLYTSKYLNYQWSGSTHLIPPLTGVEVKWCSKQLTGTAETIQVDVDDNGYISNVEPPDIGSRDDPDPAASDTVDLGAFDVKASLTVSGTNGEPITWFTFWSQHDESLHEGEEGWVEAEGIFDGVPLAGGPISLGVADYDDTTITDASTQLPTITFKGEWVLSSEPDDKWTDDLTQYAGCFVDRYIVGALHSEVWDDDIDSFLFPDYLTFTPDPPTFPSPLSWNWDRIIWDLISIAAGDDEAEGGAGLGMVFTSDFFAGSSIWQSHSEVKHQSKDYTFWSETPNSKTVPFSYDWYGEWWQFDTSNSDNSIELRGDVQGKVELVEYKVYLYEPYVHWAYFNAYAKAWSDGWACFWLDDPYYSGTPHAPDPGFLP